MDKGSSSLITQVFKKTVRCQCVSVPRTYHPGSFVVNINEADKHPVLKSVPQGVTVTLVGFCILVNSLSSCFPVTDHDWFWHLAMWQLTETCQGRLRRSWWLSWRERSRISLRRTNIITPMQRTFVWVSTSWRMTQLTSFHMLVAFIPANWATLMAPLSTTVPMAMSLQRCLVFTCAHATCQTDASWVDRCKLSWMPVVLNASCLDRCRVDRYSMADEFLSSAMEQKPLRGIGIHPKSQQLLSLDWWHYLTDMLTSILGSFELHVSEAGTFILCGGWNFNSFGFDSLGWNMFSHFYSQNDSPGVPSPNCRGLNWSSMCSPRSCHLSSVNWLFYWSVRFSSLVSARPSCPALRQAATFTNLRFVAAPAMIQLSQWVN